MDILLKNILELIDKNYQKDEDFERSFGIAKSTVSAWRRGTLKSYRKHAMKIADFFNVSADWLSGNEQKNKSTTYFDDELIKSINDPITLEIVKRLNALSPELREVALLQLESLANLSDRKDK